jgi:hypothetical protein
MRRRAQARTGRELAVDFGAVMRIPHFAKAPRDQVHFAQGAGFFGMLRLFHFIILHVKFL